MNLANFFKHILDGLWAAGGIGAAADLGLEYCESNRIIPCPAPAHALAIPLEDKLCRACCRNSSSRPLSR